MEEITEIPTYLVELYKDLPRCSPGTIETTKKAYSMLKDLPPTPKILDVGCGTGMQTIEVAKLSKAKIIALDICQPFLKILKDRAKKVGVTEQIETLNKSMFSLDFEEESFDVIWSEGSIYFYGFEKGLKDWRKFLKKQGYFVVSDCIWFSDNPPDEVKNYWEQAYPDMSSNQERVEIIKKCGFNLLGQFSFSESGWSPMYSALEEKIKILRDKYKDNNDALKEFDINQKEIDIFRKYNKYYGYMLYVLQA